MGMIFWTMYGRKPPFRKDSHDVYKQRVTAGERPKVEDSWHKGFVKVGQREERPTDRQTEEVVFCAVFGIRGEHLRLHGSLCRFFYQSVSEL